MKENPGANPQTKQYPYYDIAERLGIPVVPPKLNANSFLDQFDSEAAKSVANIALPLRVFARAGIKEPLSLHTDPLVIVRTLVKASEEQKGELESERARSKKEAIISIKNTRAVLMGLYQIQQRELTGQNVNENEIEPTFGVIAIAALGVLVREEGITRRSKQLFGRAERIVLRNKIARELYERNKFAISIMKLQQRFKNNTS